MIKIIQVGVGPLGQKVQQYAFQREGIHTVGAVDPDPAKAGKDLGELCGRDPIGVKVVKTAAEALSGEKADVAVVTTLSSLEKVAGQLEELAAAGLHIVSTCEELAYPWVSRPEIAGRLDEICKEHGVACLGTGVNPGFLMDYLPSVLTSVCQQVERVIVTRVQDASRRRLSFQQKIGAGLDPREFRKRQKNGSLRHVGLTESIHMIAGALDWKLDRVDETLEPVLARRKISSGYEEIKNGEARGVEQFGRGYVSGKEKITLHFRAAVGEAKPYDKVEIKGSPTFSSTIPGGIDGDVATAAITVNAVASVLMVKPGLKTMLDIPAPAWYSRL